MGIDLSKVEESFKKDEGIWITYPEDEDVKLKIRPLYPDKANQLTKKATKKTRTGKELDPEKLSQLTLEYILEDFKGITINGNESCTPEALLLMQKYCDSLVKFCITTSSQFADNIITEHNDTLKK